MALTAKKVYAILKRQISDMEAKLNSPVRYRGTVATADLLPLNPDIGDMYNIESKSVYGEAGMNVAWNGVVWDTMGAPIDMSLYIKSSELADWVKQQNKPTYTAEEVGALPDTTVIPSKTSDLQNDSGFLTKIPDNYLSGTDKTLSVSGQAADAKTVGDKNVELLVNILSKLDKNQGSENFGKIAGINESGDIVPMFPVSVDYNEETNCLEFGSDQKMELNKGINLDSTLTKTGYAADAGAVGEITNSLKEDIAKNKISKIYSKNLFDKNSSDIVRGVFVSNLGTNIENKYSSGYYATGYIAIEANTIYALTDYDLGGAYIAFYDKSNRFISSLQGNANLTGSKGIFTSPENAKYVRLTGNISKIDTNQLEKGDKITAYADYSEYAPLAKLEKEVEKVKKTLSGIGVNGFTTTGITGNANTLSDGEKIELESSNVKYNKHLSFFAHVTSFSGLTVGRTPTGWGASYAVIDATNITIYWYGRSATQKAQVAHGLTIKDYISVTIDVGVDVATITLRTNGGTYILKDTSWDGANGTIHAQSNGSALTDCSLSWFADSWKYDVWAFGDSYFDFYPKLIIKDGHDKWMVDMYSGRGAYAALTSFKRNLKHGRPKFALWCMGMNDVDSDIAINSKWETSTTEFISLCEQYGITPILSTIPNARGGKVEDTDIYNTRINTFKNTWIKASGHRYVDLCNAVGAETNYNWYDGMLNTGDGVHPATQGVQAIIARIYADFPEILECS